MKRLTLEVCEATVAIRRCVDLSSILPRGFTDILYQHIYNVSTWPSIMHNQSSGDNSEPHQWRNIKWHFMKWNTWLGVINVWSSGASASCSEGVNLTNTFPVTMNNVSCKLWHYPNRNLKLNLPNCFRSANQRRRVSSQNSTTGSQASCFWWAADILF